MLLQISRILLNNLDVFFINFAVFIFGYNYLFKSIKNIENDEHQKYKGIYPFVDIDDEGNEEEYDEYSLANYEIINFKIGKMYFYFGFILILIGVLISLFKNTQNLKLALICFVIYLFLGISISILIKKAEDSILCKEKKKLKEAKE